MIEATGKQFYARLVYACRRAGYGCTQQQLAARLEVSQASISKWNTDKAYPAVDVAARAAELFEVSLPWLYFGVGNHDDTPDPNFDDLVRFYRDMNYERRVALRDIARVLAGLGK